SSVSARSFAAPRVSLRKPDRPTASTRVRASLPSPLQKDGLLDHLSLLQVLHHDSLEQFGSYVVVPDAVRVYDHYGTSGADAETRRLATLPTRRANRPRFALLQGRD